jgi:hypothetical protein
VVGPLETVVQVQLLIVSHLVVLNTFEVYANPVTNSSVGNMLEFDADLTTICCFVCLDNITKLPDSLLCHNGTLVGELNIELTIQVRLRKAVLSVV